MAVGVGVLALIGTLALSAAMLWALHDLKLERPVEAASNPALIVEAVNGEPLGRVGPLKVAEAAREDFPDHLVQAVLSIEDRRFYRHIGFDPEGIARAASRNIEAGEIIEGGSTITQQLVKMRYVGNDRSFTRKLREALTAMWLELRLSKDEILTAYLNTVYMGSGTHGMAAAARLYFDKQLSELTLPEAAMLAGMIKAPSRFNPLRNLQMAQARAAAVLDSMVANGAISAETAADAKRKKVTLKPAREFMRAGSWFADWVAREAAQVTGTFTRSIRVRTTLDPRLQRLAEKVVNDLLESQGPRAGVSQAALVALRPDGAVLAMVGGSDYRDSQFNRAVEANRHPGSAFKLFVYLAALRKGYSPHDVIDAGPVEIKGWRPDNFGGREYGRMTLTEAFTRSINTAAVRLAMDVGLNEVISAARDLGINAPLSPVPSLALGAVEVSLLDLTGAFASMRAGRMRVEPWGIAAFGAEDQARLRTLGPPITGSNQPLPHQQAMTDLLRQVVERGTGRGAALNGFAAGKTGTSQNHRDAWFIGFNESLVVGVWVGNDDGTPMERVVGGTLPASIWKRFMTEATGIVGKDPPQIAERPESLMVTTGIGHEQASSSSSEQMSASASQPGQCDYRACASAYRSFRASDCSYQSYSGPRRTCEMRTRTPGDPAPVAQAPRETRAKAPAPQTATETGPASKAGERVGKADQQPKATTEGRGRARCDVDACGRKYRSFNASDCTYQPFDRGPRQLCEMGAQSTATRRTVPAATEKASSPPTARAPASSEQAPPIEDRVQPSRWRRVGRPEQVPEAPAEERRPAPFFGLFGRRDAPPPQPPPSEGPSRPSSFRLY
ncbi:MAG: PBP1A family penicillin-binding protein [Xanthobacteraceae bacterium]